jgi:hypothetical protein
MAVTGTNSENQKMKMLVQELVVNGVAFTPSATSITVLTDSSGGTASNTIADVPATYTEATLANQLASLAAKINEVIAVVNAQA